MSGLSATELASQLNLTKGRISQYVSEGKLEGCYEGEGRARRFDLGKVASALGRRLDLGQMMGNGLDTRRAIRAIRAGANEGTTEPVPARKSDGPLPLGDRDEMELVKVAKANEELRKLRRDNEVAEGSYVLASEVERQTAKALGREISGFESVLRDGARAIADKMGVDFKLVRRILLDQFRAYRANRVGVLTADAEEARATEAEISADI